MLKLAKHLFFSVTLLLSQVSWAQMVSPLDVKGPSASEYFVGRQLGKPLLTVNLLNGVSRPGVYHVPVGTDIAQLIAYAGGSVPNADLGDISIQRKEQNQRKLVEVNLDKIIRSTTAFPKMHDEDVIHIDKDVAFDNTIKWVGLLATVTSVVLSYYIIQDVRD